MSIDRGMDKEDEVHIHNGILLSCEKKNEIMLFAATWMDLEIIILTEVRQKNKYITCMWNRKRKMIQMNLFTKEKQFRRFRKQIYGYQRRKGGRIN